LKWAIYEDVGLCNNKAKKMVARSAKRAKVPQNFCSALDPVLTKGFKKHLMTFFKKLPILGINFCGTKKMKVFFMKILVGIV
jgi:hypothetical protein